VPPRSPPPPPPSFGELADQLLELAERHDVGCVLSHYLFEDRDAAWIDALVARGGVPLVLGADCHLELSWTSTEDYLAGFGSSRRAVRRAHAGMHRSGLARLARRAAGTGPGERAAAALFGEYTATFDPQHGPPASLLGAVAEGRELDRVLFSVADNGGDARSVMAALVHGDVLYPKFFGTSRPRRDYFALAYCQLIEYAIAEGYRRIEFGGGTHQAKLFRGGRLRFALGVLFVRDRALRGAALAAGHQLSAAKISHFQTLAERWQIDHRAPPAPAIFSRPAGQRTSAPPNAER
ncbi:MAG: peptidogalycan biosysnthesis protein, partial [Jatrophihabitans sp.]